MSLLRGLQSAFFYYLSCSPCREKASYRRRRKEAKIINAEKDAYYAANPGQARQVSPFATNPAWQIEIERGPNYVKPKRSKPKTYTTSSPLVGSSSPTSSATSTKGASNSDLAAQSAAEGDALQQQEQRGEEALWGTPDGAPRPTSAKSASTNTSGSTYMHYAEINDRHPSTITRYDSVTDVAWMMQPPPPARFMENKHEPNHKSAAMPTGILKRQRPAKRQFSCSCSFHD